MNKGVLPGSGAPGSEASIRVGLLLTYAPLFTLPLDNDFPTTDVITNLPTSAGAGGKPNDPLWALASFPLPPKGGAVAQVADLLADVSVQKKGRRHHVVQSGSTSTFWVTAGY